MAEALNPITIYIIAGEASGDFLGVQLMRALKKQSARPIRFYGVGGERMESEGIKSLFPYHELSMLGFVEVLPHALAVFARVNLTVEDILIKRPDIVITIDVPGFSFRVAEKLRQEKTTAKLIHYVAPTVWVYKPQRAELFARLFDHILVLFPFEPPYFEKAGLACTLTGHPVIAETKIGGGAAFRKKYDIADDTLLFCLLPGSRKGEIKQHMPVFARAVMILATRYYPKLALVITVPRHTLPLIAPYFKNCPFRAIITADEEDKKNAIASADMAIVKSGTVAFEVAMAGVPMLVAYRLHVISAWIMRRIAKTRFANLVNIILDREVIPELLQELCQPLLIASCAAQLLQDKDAQIRQKTAIDIALAQLIPPSGEMPSDIAARTILQTI